MTNFTWTSLFTGGSFFALITLIIRQIGPWRKQRDEAEENLRVALTERVDKLEATLEYTRVKHEAERSLDRHKIGNLMQCLDALLIILETSPERTADIVPKIRAMRNRQIEEERIESAALHAADLAARAQGLSV